MLDYKTDRLDYGQLLIPPRGYRLDRAVAATYSADLNTLLSIPVALFYSQTLEGQFDGERFQVLEAIRRTAAMMTVYCQERQIHVPGRYNRLFAFMEEMIVAVRPVDAFTSFHPKLWVLRYVQEGSGEKPFYRVLVLSRNLTRDRCWDVATTMEGFVGASAPRVNRPLTQFLTYLNGIRPFADYQRFTKDLAKVKFGVPAGFNKFAFHPLGIRGFHESPFLGHQAQAAICISPFIDDDILRNIKGHSDGKLWVFGRREEMRKLSREALKGSNAYCISDLVVEGETWADVDGSDEHLEQNLHAKVFGFQEADTSRWFIGSANATRAGCTRNTEFMVELVGAKRQVRLETVVEELLGDKACRVFEEFQEELAGAPDESEAKRAALRRLEYKLASAPLQGTVCKAKNGSNFDVTVRLDLRTIDAVKGLTLAVGPLNYDQLLPAKLGKENQLTFDNIALTELSRFIVFEIREGDELLRQFVLKYSLEGMPVDRDDAIFKSIVSNREEFFEYLRFLLAEQVSKADLLPTVPPHRKEPPGNDEQCGWNDHLPIFESMLIAAARNPEKLTAVDAIIQRLGAGAATDKSLVEKEFLDFWEVFRRCVAKGDGKEGANGR